MRLFLHALLIVLSCLMVACTPDNFRGTDVSNVQWGGDFELTAHTGKRVHASDFLGKAVVLFFGFTNCPDICAPTLTKLTQAMKLLGHDAERVQVLFVTVDPQRDTPTQLAGFVPTFHPSFIGLTGTPAELTAVARDYRVAAESDSQSPGGFMHSGAVMVKDTRGKLRLVFKDDAGAEDIAHDLRMLLKE